MSAEFRWKAVATNKFGFTLRESGFVFLTSDCRKGGEPLSKYMLFATLSDSLGEVVLDKPFDLIVQSLLPRQCPIAGGVEDRPVEGNSDLFPVGVSSVAHCSRTSQLAGKTF